MALAHQTVRNGERPPSPLEAALLRSFSGAELVARHLKYSERKDLLRNLNRHPKRSLLVAGTVSLP
jgi:hypothetical protein